VLLHALHSCSGRGAAASMLMQLTWRGIVSVGSKSKDASENGSMMGKIVWRDIWLVLDGWGTMDAL
jgi:hypothetical protein